MEINEDLYRSLEKAIYPDFDGFLDRMKNFEKIYAMILVGSYSKENSRKDSDYDIAIVVEDGMKEKYVQVLHYLGDDALIDVMIFERNEIINNTRPRLFGVILRNGKIVFCKNEELKKSLNEIIVSKESFESHPYELESIWFRLFWRIKKIDSYLGIDEDIARLVAFQTHVFIGLMYSKLNGVENYSYTSNLKFMKENHPHFWKKYNEVFNDSLNITENIKIIIKNLPGYSYYCEKKSLVELDNFLSPITVLEGGMGDSIIKKEIDKLML